MKKSFHLLLRIVLVIMLFIAMLNVHQLNAQDVIFPEIQFRDLQKNDYYHDEAELNRLRILHKEGPANIFYEALVRYVEKFGNENFKDTRMLEILAGTAGSLGYKDEEASWNRLALRHYSSNVLNGQLRRYRDSINLAGTGGYVPLAYFNQLANRAYAVDSVLHYLGVNENMGERINTPSSEYAPSYNSRNHLMIFTSQRGSNRLSQAEDLYLSKLDSTGEWTQAAKMDQINTPYNEGSGCITNDGKTIYFSRCNSPENMGICDLYMAELDDQGTWTNVRNLGPEVNSKYWDSHPTLSHSEDTLFFSSDRPGGFGLCDLYFTYKTGNGAWSRPSNLGPFVNTKNQDINPFYHPEHNVLYFASNGQPVSFGSLDIYKAYMDERGRWSEPVNIGPVINTPGHEMYFTLNVETNFAFFARSESDDLEKLDLYTAPLPMSARPDRLVPLHGFVLDSLTGKPMAGIVSITDLDEGIEVPPKFLGEDGSFTVGLIPGHYKVEIRGDDFLIVEKEFHVGEPTVFREKVVSISTPVTFENVHFDFDKHDIKESALTDLNKVARFILENPGYRLKIEGHTDNEGAHEYNIGLSQRRAESIARYLEDHGIDRSRIQCAGYGFTQPLINEATDHARAVNRRVEFYFYHPNHFMASSEAE